MTITTSLPNVLDVLWKKVLHTAVEMSVDTDPYLAEKSYDVTDERLHDSDWRIDTSRELEQRAATIGASIRVRFIHVSDDHWKMNVGRKFP